MPDFTSQKREPNSLSVLAIAVPMILANATVPLVGVVDTVVIGQLDDPALIGGVSLGSTIFSAMFWVFGFLRMGTTALTAQAVGADNSNEVAAHLFRALVIATGAGSLLFAVHVPAILFTLKLIGGGAEVQTAAADYFGLRILSAPATLANYAIFGWLVGLARARAAFWLQLLLNASNIVLAVTLVLGVGKGVKGAAIAAVVAEYLALAAGLVIARLLLRETSSRTINIWERKAFSRALAVNADIMIRTICLLFAFTFFAAQGAQFGDIVLAANSVLRNLSDVSAYMLDGFAFAAEVLVGRAVGARSVSAFRQAVRLSSLWAAALAALLSLVFLGGGLALLRLMTTTEAVREAAYELLPWAAAVPIAGVACFQLDGIFIGATRTKDMRNMMIVSLVLFLIAWAVLADAFGNSGLWASLIVFFLVRAVTLASKYPALERALFLRLLPQTH